MKICNQCQKTFSDEEAFCDTCGVPLSPAGGVVSAAVVEGNINRTDKADKTKKILVAVIIVLSVLTVFAGIMGVVTYSEYSVERSKLWDQRSQNQALQREVDFYQEHIALVNEDDKYYHKQSCDYFDDSSFWAYNTEQAKTKGYSACPKCYGK